MVADDDMFFAAMRVSGIATVLTDPTRPGNPIVFANDAFSSLTGFADDEIIGRNCRFLEAPDTDPATIRTLDEAIDAQRPIAVEIRNRKRNGTVFWCALSMGPVYDTDGNLRHFVSNHVDVTRHRNAEDALHRLQKMDAIGQLTGGVAHDFNNLLTVIMTSVEWLRRGNLSEEKRTRYIEAIGATADRAAKLTGQLLAFARQQPLEAIIFDASEQVGRTADMLRTIVGARINVTTELAFDRCLIKADISQFETALVNIAVNGRDAMRGQGHLTITVERLSGIPALRREPAVSGEFVAVAITDTGSGIPHDRLEQIFERLYTTKKLGSGTGLGLSQVYGFAKECGGEVRVKSELGRATTFVLYLPSVEAAQVSGSTTDSQRPFIGHGRLLMVEHHVQIAEITSELLKDLGYDVRSVANGAEALAAVESEVSGFDLVFSDVVMPGNMSGIELANELNLRRPGLPILLTTGYSNVLAKNEELEGHFRVLRKPYSAEALTSLIGDMIRSSKLGHEQ